MATRNLVINDPVGIHARPAAMFEAVTASGQTVTIAKGRRQRRSGRLHPVHHGSGHQAGRYRGHQRRGDNDETVADNLVTSSSTPE